jgi:hypothetical protein
MGEFTLHVSHVLGHEESLTPLGDVCAFLRALIGGFIDSVAIDEVTSSL